MLTLQELQTAVGKWSMTNFGGQETKRLHCYILSEKTSKIVDVGDPTHGVVLLGSLAPLMGLVEEMGEFFEAKTPEDKEDALGDLVIYLCDYAFREEFQLSDIKLEEPNFDFSRRLDIALGRLFHCHLKRLQGIRGMDDDFIFRKKRNEAVGMVLSWLGVCREDNKVLRLANKTWETVLKKRDWKSDPIAGGGHTHEIKSYSLVESYDEAMKYLNPPTGSGQSAADAQEELYRKTFGDEHIGTDGELSE
jgi:hypothetical protein